MHVDFLKAGELDRIEHLLVGYKFNRYINYWVLNKKELHAYIFKEIADFLKEGGCIITVTHRNRIIGFAVMGDLPWDTAYFGAKMARIHYLISEGEYSQQVKVKDKLLDSAAGVCKEKEICHISCKVNPADFSSIHCLENAKFRLMGTSVTFLFSRKVKIPGLKNLYRIREFKADDQKDLVDIVKSNFWINRFYCDPHIPRRKAIQFYAEWVNNCFNKSLADEILVAERNGKVVGFFTYKLDKRLSAFAGINFFGRGIAAVLPGAKGAYVNLLEAAIEKARSNFGNDCCGELDTQIWNYQAIKVFQRFRMDFVNSAFSFHNWLCD
jgi:hypothetical protein